MTKINVRMTIVISEDHQVDDEVDALMERYMSDRRVTVHSNGLRLIQGSTL